MNRDAFKCLLKNLLYIAKRAEMSFFVVCPYIFFIFAPKIGMNCNKSLIILSSFDSSRFSRPCTLSYVKGIPKKDIPMFLICIASPQKGIR
jgi:hypothetical protein